MPSLVDLLGEKVVGKEGLVDTKNFETEGKVIGLYFSAHWCPPCRGFTPELVTFYNKLHTSADSKLEIVFVSSDKSEDEFKEYFAEMPWHALPFADRDRKQKLSKRFKVQGIPMLVFIDGTSGNLITGNGRGCVADDPEGKDFPWHPKPLSEILSGKMLKGEEEVDIQSVISGKVVGIYFSAHWCPPCRSFTPDLISAYNKIREAGKQFEIIFLSSDRSVDSFKEYYETMPWHAIPYEENEKKKMLSSHFGIEGIPTLILLNEQLELVSSNGRGIISKDKDGLNFPWPPKPVSELDDCTASVINEMCCMILFTGGDEQMITQCSGLMTETATTYLAEKKSGMDIPDLAFLYEGVEGDELSDSLHFFALLPDHSPKLVILDIPEQKKYVHPAGPITKEVVASVAADFKSGKLEFSALRA